MSLVHHKIASANTESEPGNDDEISCTELDSHADSPVVGRYSSVLEDTGRKPTVTIFTRELGEPMTVMVVTAAVAYDCEYTGKTFISVIYSALYFQNMGTNLVPPIRMHLSGLDVDESPKLMSGKPTEKNRSVYFLMSDIRLPLQLEGKISYIPTRRPLKVELKESEGEYMLLTPNTPG